MGTPELVDTGVFRRPTWSAQRAIVTALCKWDPNHDSHELLGRRRGRGGSLFVRDSRYRE
jgi:hypothetical protein